MRFVRGNLLIVLLLVASLFKELLWSALVPIWQAPDEQAHFAELQYFAEKKTEKMDPERNLSEEVLLSEELLGTRRDGRGNNKFTYHPEYKISYSGTYTGPDEREIDNQPSFARVNMVAQEAAGYPPLYYRLALPLYNLFWSHGLIDRLYVVRMVSVVLGLVLVVTAYEFGMAVWGKGIRPLVLAILVSFQPMVSFVGAGFHPDNLLNLLSTIGMLGCLLLLRNGLKLRYLLLIFSAAGLGVMTKQLMIFMLPVFFFGFVITASQGKKWGWLLGLATLASPVAAFFAQLDLPYMPRVTTSSPLYSMSFWDYMRFRGPKLFFEIWPWFWGVFKWLGVTLPPLVLKVVTRAAILAGIGLGVKGLLVAKNRDFSFETKAIAFLALAVTSYLFYLVVWDYRLMQSIGWSQGLQGRYLFTVLVPAMVLLMVGVLSIIPRSWKGMTVIVLVLLALGMILLNGVALYVVARSYYDLSSFNSFVIQASQYKPLILKSSGLVILMGLALSAVGGYVLILVRAIVSEKQEESRQ